MIKPKLIIDSKGNKRWFNSKNQLHRKIGPAIIITNGETHWRINGYSHRIDGPANVYPDEYKSWFIKDMCVRKFEYD